MTGCRMVVLGATVCLLPIAAGYPQGLGDAAKKEKARREQPQPKPVKTYSEGDLKALPPVANEDSAPSTAPATAKATTDSATAAAGGGDDAQKRASDERMWRSRVAAARERVDAARKKYEALAATGGDPRFALRGLREVTDPAIIAAAKADLDHEQKALDDLLEEARRANVPPGWLR